MATPMTLHAWDRGTVDRFATLPAGTGHPEGICTDNDGNVYVATVDVPRPERKNGTLIVFDSNGKYLRTVNVADSSTQLLDIRFHPQTGKLTVVDYGAAKLLTVDPQTGASSVFMTVTGAALEAAGFRVANSPTELPHLLRITTATVDDVAAVHRVPSSHSSPAFVALHSTIYNELCALSATGRKAVPSAQ